MNKELVSIKRDTIDGNTIQGFVLDQSKQLILLHYVYDFHLDGLMVLRKKDISSLDTSKTDRFQTNLLKDEGIFEKIDFESSYNLASWQTFIADAAARHDYCIVEEEACGDPTFTIGIIEKIDDESIAMKQFTGAGRFLENHAVIAVRDITCIQIGSNYLNVYERHFNKTGR